MNANRFEAIQLIPEGWIVLSPVIETQDGQSYRHRVPIRGRGRYSSRARREAEHLANQLNAAIGPPESGQEETVGPRADTPEAPPGSDTGGDDGGRVDPYDVGF